MTMVEMGTRVSSGELAERLDRVTVLDVRTPGEFSSVHIPGSFNLPLDRLPEYVDALGNAVNSPVVLVCRSGQRATEAERGLQAVDLPGLHVLDGGLGAWESAGLPVVRGAGRWSMERQVRGVAGALVLAGLLGGLVVPPLRLVSAFVGGGLFVSAITNSCMMARLLAKLPYNREAATCDISRIVWEVAAKQPKSMAAD
jgi:rhodanese-related sulfurtransferase